MWSKKNNQLKKETKIIIVFFMLGALLGSLSYELVPISFEGTLILDPAKIAGKNIEKISSTLTKLNMLTFYSDEALSICKIANTRELKEFKKYSSKDNTFILIKIISKDQARISSCLDIIKKEINKDEAERFKILLNKKITELEFINKQIKLTEILNKKINIEHLPELMLDFSKIESYLLHTNLAVTTITNLRSLIDAKFKLENEINPINSHPTVSLLPVYVEKKEVPKTIFIVFCGFLGITLKLILLMLRRKNFNIRQMQP
jgi:hypothetical protein